MRYRLALAVAAALELRGHALARAQSGPPGTTPPTTTTTTTTTTAPAPKPAPTDGDDDDTDYMLFGEDTPDDAWTNDNTDDTDDATKQVTTGALRLGVYDDTDQTQVIRSLADVTAAWGGWSLTGSAGVNVVTSASVNVRASPALSKVNVVTSASGRTSSSGGQMHDTRYQATGAAGWDDGAGHKLSLTSAAAAETDYGSLSGGLNSSLDVYDRQVTLLGGLSYTHNWISSVLDRRLRETSYNVGWSTGLALVTTPRDALRLRYDGSSTQGYQSSPYRSVRFGDWTTSVGSNDQIMFQNTIGSADGLPESVPRSRISHAAVLELVHSLGDGVGLHPALRLGHDSWDIQSLTASLDLRVAKPSWRLKLGYRFYAQTRADFFHDKYTLDPSMYPYYTSDKELGDEQGHMVDLDVSTVLSTPDNSNDTRLLLDAHVTLMHYNYPGFVLLESRDGAFLELGLTWEM